MRAKDRHIKPHFTVNGQIWFVEKDLDPREFEFSPDPAIRAWFGPDQMRHLVSVYEWWKRKDAASARITDAMLIRHCDSYQLIDGRGKMKYRVVHRPDIPVFIRYPDRRHSKNWRDRTVPHLKKDERMSVDMMLRSGYCRTSNNHLIISRIDCPNWREKLAVHFSPHDPEAALDRTYGRNAADYYRRCLSKDRIRLADRAQYGMFPGSADGYDYFIPMCEVL